MTQLKKNIKAMAGRFAAATGQYRKSFQTLIVVTAFHRVNDSIPEDGLTCSSAKFDAFCRFFRRHFRVVPLSEQVAGLRRGDDMGGTLSITFDDGYMDNYEVAAPILRTHNLPATFFVSTGFLGSNKVPFWDRDLPQPPRWMQWQHVRKLADAGFEIGCHTVSHLDMGKAPPDVVREELTASRKAIEEQTGRKAALFAYPFGGKNHLSETSLEVVRELGFECCASCFGGVNGNTTDPYAIKRVGMSDWYAHAHQFGFELMSGRA